MKLLTPALLLAVTVAVWTGAVAAAGGETEVLGQGEFRYRYRAEKLAVPDSLSQSWQHVHGITLTPAKEIVVTYSTDGPHDQSTRALARFNLDGEFLGTAGSRALARGTPHGLDGLTENGEYYLYHSNNAGQVYKTDASGELIWSIETPPDLPAYTPTVWSRLQAGIIDYVYREFSHNLTLLPTAYMPCNVAFHPEQPVFYMADCYGSSYIHTFSSTDGSYQGHSFGGQGDQAGQFNTPHGLIYDPRKGQLLVADRGNGRLQYVDFEGNPVALVQHAAIEQPCDFDLRGEHLLIPDLAGHMLVLDGNNEVVSRLDVADLLGEQGVRYPHDAIFLPNYDIVLATWNPGTLTYFERVRD